MAIFRLPRFAALQHVSVLPDVWRMCAFTVCLAFLLCQVYNPIRRAVRDGQKKTLLFYLFHDCDAFFTMCTTFVTFILSFFNATVYSRWWRLRELCGTVNGKTVRRAGPPPASGLQAHLRRACTNAPARHLPAHTTPRLPGVRGSSARVNPKLASQQEALSLFLCC